MVLAPWWVTVRLGSRLCRGRGLTLMSCSDRHRMASKTQALNLIADLSSFLRSWLRWLRELPSSSFSPESTIQFFFFFFKWVWFDLSWVRFLFFFFWFLIWDYLVLVLVFGLGDLCFGVGIWGWFDFVWFDMCWCWKCFEIFSCCVLILFEDSINFRIYMSPKYQCC